MKCQTALGILLLLSGGCGTSASTDQALPLDQVPENILKAADEERARSLPDVKFERATRRSDGSYEIRGKGKTGKVRDVELDANAKIIEVE